MGPLGHFGVGFAAKSTSRKADLWVFLLASEVLDLLSFAFVGFGIEEVSLNLPDFIQGDIALQVPWSHSLPMAAIWSLLASGIAFLIFREIKTSTILGALVFSHWLLDLLVHPPDLPLLFKGSQLVGLGLWTSRPGLIISFILEFALLATGVSLYMRAKKLLRDR